MIELSRNYQEILQRVRKAALGRPGGKAPTLLAVSKGQSLEAIEALYNLGQRDFAENYVQELLGKSASMRERGYSDLRWHLIGHLQSNKVKAVLPHVSSIHSVDSLKLATMISKHWERLGKASPFPIFLEVNWDHENSKSGFAPEEGVGALREIRNHCPAVQVSGLMMIPAPRPSAAEQARVFADFRKFSGSIGELTGGQLSMGMSADFEMAIAEGATHVRVGTALFGARQ